MRYIALLRGINVGGNKKIKVADLRELLGFANVKTVLASGNVAFDSDETDCAALKAEIEQRIESNYGFSVSTQVFPQERLSRLVESNPFADIEVTKETRLYVTFLPKSPNTTLEIPYQLPEQDFTILSVSETEVCSVLQLSPKSRTVDSMKILEQEFGKNITTRNWNTVMKLADL